MTKPIKRETHISITPTSEELAEVFWSMGSDEQAAFFNHLHEISAYRLCFQLQAVTDGNNLNTHGRRVMQMIGEYSGEQK